MNSLRGIAGRSLTYNAEDQLLSVGSATYQYDTDGFLSKKTDGSSITTYNYSSRGELLSASLPDGRSVEYVNDPMGRRIAKKINGVIVEKYLWASLTQLLAVYDGSDNLLMRFEYADGRMPSAMTKGSETYYLTYDQVGSLRAVSNATGTVVKRIDYDSFGNILTDTAPAFTVPFGFAGGLHDRDVALVRFGYRDYDPATGRWTAKDPISFAGGDVDLYGYVLNDPVNLIDPTGLSSVWDDFWNWEDFKLQLNDAWKRWLCEGFLRDPLIALSFVGGGILSEFPALNALPKGKINDIANWIRNKIFRWGYDTQGKWGIHFHLGPAIEHHLPYQIKRWFYHTMGIIKSWW